MTNTVRTFRVRFDNAYGDYSYIESTDRVAVNNFAKKVLGCVDELINGKFIFLGNYVYEDSYRDFYKGLSEEEAIREWKPCKYPVEQRTAVIYEEHNCHNMTKYVKLV